MSDDTFHVLSAIDGALERPWPPALMRCGGARIPK